MCQRRGLGYIASEVDYLKHYYLKSETYSKDEIGEKLEDKANKEDLTGLATEEYVNSKLGDIDAILTNIADESEAI